MEDSLEQTLQTLSQGHSLPLLRQLVDGLLSQESPLLEQFCQLQGLSVVTALFSSGDREVKVAVINNLSLLMLNLSHRPTLAHILSQGLLDPLILQGVDMQDDELVDYFIAFLKQIAQLVTSSPQDYLPSQGSYALLSMSMLFSRHPSSMVRTTFRNIVLSLLQCKHPFLVSLFSQLPYCILWNNLTLTLSCLWEEMDGLIDNYHRKEAGRLQGLMDESQDILLFFQDIFQLDIPQVSAMLSEAFLWNCLNASLLQSFTFCKKGHLAISLAMLQLQESLSKIKYPPVLTILIKCLYQNSLEPALHGLVSRSLSPCLSLREYGCVQDMQFWKEYSGEEGTGRQALLDHFSLSLEHPEHLLLEVERALGMHSDYSWLSLEEYQQKVYLEANTVSQVLSSFMFCKDDNLLYSSLSLMQSALSFEPTRKCLLEDHLVLQLESMLSTFRKEPAVRVCTAKTLGQCLENIYGCPSISQERLFTNSSVSLFNQVFLFQVNAIYEVLKNPLVVDHFINHFEEEHRRHQSPSYLSLDNRLTHRHLIYYDETVINSLSPEYRPSLTLFEQAKSQVQTLFILARLKALLRGEDLVQQHFQQLKAQVYHVLSPEEPLPRQKHDMVACKVMESPRWQAYCVTEDIQHLVLAQRKEDNLYTVKKALCLKNADWSIDKANKKQLLFSCSGKVTVLLFDSRSKAESIRHTLDYNRKQSKQFDVSIILRYLNKLEKELVPYSEECK